MNAPRLLQRAGWTWTDAGVLIDVVVDGTRMSVLVPMRRVAIEFDRPMREVGCPIRTVGALNAVGFFGSIRKAVKKVGRAATKAVSKGARGVAKVADRAAKVGKSVVRNKYFRAGLAAASVAVPALAPVAVGVETAARVIQHYEDGKAVAKRIAATNVTRPGDVAKMATAVAAEQAVGQIAKQAQRGSADAQRFIGGIEAAKAARARAIRPPAQRAAVPIIRRPPIGPFRGMRL